ncbi:hypothetical protein [Actinomadura formosensis]|uniref:hypothetical protein n=1 Tax=Actinomadura formosensis TaxID=60706 RepID=UPI003D90D8B8
MLISNGRIAAITEDLPPGPVDEAVDTGGCTLLPGFWDAHVHMTQWASARRRVDLSGAVTDEIWTKAARHHDERQLGAPVLMVAITNFLNRINTTLRVPAGTSWH